MTTENGTNDDGVQNDTSRRTFLKAAAATGAIAGFSGVGLTQEDGTTTTQQDGESEGFFPEGPTVGVQSVAQGMTAPTDFAVANEDTDRQFVTDQTGEVYVIDGDGLQEEPFLNVSDKLVELGTFAGDYGKAGSGYDERGLLGIEFHPDFQNNRRFYIHYSAPPNDNTPDRWSHVEVISEYMASEDLSSADPESERMLFQIQSPQYNHDAGPMAFGPDGYLYIPMGDGGGANDNMLGHVSDWYDDNEGGNGQDVTENLLGNVLRIDVDSEASQTPRNGEGGETADNQDGDMPYAIPDDNPLVDGEGRDEIYAWGFRNPFGISFDSDGRLFVADAGQNLFEEASLVERGGNYGWNVKEGTHCFSPQSPGNPPAECPSSTPEDVRGGEPLIDPIVEYPHSYNDQPVGIVIVGGHVFESDAVPELQGKYIFGDWTRDIARQEPDGRIFTAQPREGQETGTGTETETAAGTETEGETGAGNETGTEMAAETGTEMGNATGTEMENETGTATTEMEAGTGTTTEMAAETGTETGNETDTEMGNQTGTGTQTGTPSGTDVPRDQLWEMEEVQFEGSENGNLNYFVRMFGQDENGDVYVLVSRRGIPEGNTGEVLKLVPADEGEQISTPSGNETATTEGGTTMAGTETETGTEAETGTETETDTGTTAGNETTEN